MTAPTKAEPSYDLAFCADCEAAVEEPSKVYECPECGDTFTAEETDNGEGNRSPCCGKFGLLSTATGCPECKGELTLYREVEP